MVILFITHQHHLVREAIIVCSSYDSVHQLCADPILVIISTNQPPAPLSCCIQPLSAMVGVYPIETMTRLLDNQVASLWNVKVALPDRLVSLVAWSSRFACRRSARSTFAPADVHPCLHCVAGSSPAEPGSSKTARGGEVRDRFSPSAHLPSRAEGPNKGRGHHFFWVCACGPSL